MTRKPGREGFSLVEALVAITILGIAATSIMTAFSAALLAGKTSEDFAVASLLMDDLHTYVRTEQLTPATENQGSFTNNPQYTWEVLFTITEVSGLYQVDFFVYWKRGESVNQLHTATYQYSASAAAAAAETAETPA